MDHDTWEDEEWWDARESREDSLGKECERAASKSVNAVLVSLGRAIGQVVSNLESPADAAVAAVDGLLEGIVAELGPSDREAVLALLRGSEKKRTGRRRG